MKPALTVLLASLVIACTNEKPPESTYGSTDTILSQTDTTLTSTAGPITATTTAPTDTTNTEYGGTTATDTSNP